jgi:hypothetical protein
MKTFTITALMATLVAIPLILRMRRIQPVPVEPEGVRDDPRRYDLFDFVN